ncbi:MAG TPA: hypothetical protein VGK08_00400, partial [Thermoanaerobaculia bacterium]
ISWSRWIEPYVDTGRELMVPWRVTHGEALYREVRFYYGPLAPYLAAAVDIVAGRSFPARVALAGLVALLHIEALRRLARRLLPDLRAAVVTSLVVATTFFLRPGGCHLFPYSLDTSIAVMAVTASLLLASSGGSPARDRGAAGCLLAALLSRSEIGVVGIIALAVERFVGKDSAAKRRLPALALLPLLLAAATYAILSAGTPLPVLKKEGWLTFLFLPPEFRSVYTSFAGVDRPGLRAAELGLASIALLAIGLWLLLASLATASARRRSAAAGHAIEIGAIAVLAAASIVRLRPPSAIRDIADLLPPLVRAVPPLLFAVAAVGLVRRSTDRTRASILPGVPDPVLLVSLFFAARLLLAAGYVGPYNGFYLPLPLLVSVVLLLRAAERIPERLDIFPRPTALPGLLVAALALFLAVRTAALALLYRHPAWSRVPTPAGSLFVPEPVASATRAALVDLARRVPAGGKITGFPETGFFNWTLGLANPLAQDQFFPGHLDGAAEDEAISRLRRDPPDAVVYADVLTIGHGRTAFGRDYLERLDRFVRESFPTAASYGPGARAGARIGDPGFFIEIRVPRVVPP